MRRLAPAAAALCCPVDAFRRAPEKVDHDAAIHDAGPEPSGVRYVSAVGCDARRTEAVVEEGRRARRAVPRDAPAPALDLAAAANHLHFA